MFANMSSVFLVLLFVPIILFALEIIAYKINKVAALIIPLFIVFSSILFSFYALITAAIMYGIFFIMNYVEKQNKERKAEMEKMNIKDL